MRHATLLVGCSIFLAVPTAAQVVPQKIAPEDAPATVTVAKENEPGERLMVSGTVTDGKVPVHKASVYVFQTDATGHYTPGETGPGSEDNPRLYGAMRTDAQGHYSYSTIRPAPYPNRAIPAHIHYVVTATGYKERRFEVWFDGDPLLTSELRELVPKREGRFYIESISRGAGGTLRLQHDVVLTRN